jgi:hypothetical protein
MLPKPMINSMKSSWAEIAAFLVVGYFSMSRSFAYLGVPQLSLFVGEIVLGYFLVCGPGTSRGRWPWIAMKAPALKSVVRVFSLLFAYGIFQVFRGISTGYPPMTAVRDLAFNYYPLYLFLGVFVGLRSPGFLPKLVRLLAWFNGIYGVAYILFFSTVPWTIPGVSANVVAVPLFGEPFGSAIVLLGLLAFEPDLWSVWHLFLLNVFVLLGMQIRGEWLAFGVGLLLWGWLAKRLRQFGLAGAFLLFFFILMFALDVRIQGPEVRGAGVISARDIVGRVIAPVAPDLAAEYTDNYQTASDTTLWRTIWWAEIFISVHATPVRAILGYGYGFPLGDLVPYLEGQFIRTPHNFFLYALGYGGWLGVALFFAFQIALAKLLWRGWQRTGQPFGFLFWAACLVLASFTAFFETPYGAIPFYLIVGCAIAPAVCSQDGAALAAQGSLLKGATSE